MGRSVRPDELRDTPRAGRPPARLGQRGPRHDARCVLCGMISQAERIKDGPYPTVTRDVTMGGSWPKKDWATDKYPGGQHRRGRIEMGEITPYTREELLATLEALDRAREQILRSLAG